MVGEDTRDEDRALSCHRPNREVSVRRLSKCACHEVIQGDVTSLIRLDDHPGSNRLLSMINATSLHFSSQGKSWQGGKGGQSEENEKPFLLLP